jgi:hypothetical protein
MACAAGILAVKATRMTAAVIAAALLSGEST